MNYLNGLLIQLICFNYLLSLFIWFFRQEVNVSDVSIDIERVLVGLIYF